ncbi:hypothetical protein pb186bvf_020653 [Paramecium bursaria]
MPLCNNIGQQRQYQFYFNLIIQFQDYRIVGVNQQRHQYVNIKIKKSFDLYSTIINLIINRQSNNQCYDSLMYFPNSLKIQLYPYKKKLNNLMLLRIVYLMNNYNQYSGGLNKIM